MTKSLMTESGPADPDADMKFDAWIVVYPGKMGMSWRQHTNLFEDYESAKKVADANCNTCVIPYPLWSYINRLQRERRCRRTGDPGAFTTWIAYELTKEGIWKTASVPFAEGELKGFLAYKEPPWRNFVPVPLELHRHLTYLECEAATKLESEPDGPMYGEPLILPKRKHVAHEYWAAVHIHPGDLPAAGYASAFFGTCPTLSKHDAVQKANNAVDLVALPHNLLRYIRDLERQVAQHKQEEKKDASPQPVTKPVQLNGYASGVGMWVTGWPFSSLPDGARGEVHYGPDGRETYQPYGLE